MNSSARIWNRFAKGYAKKPVTDEAAYQHKLEQTRARMTPDMEVLEFGCGTGTTALKHGPHVAHITAIDYSDAMIDIAKGRQKEAGIDNVTFRVASIEDWPAENGTYDMILGLSILHLLENPASVLARVHDLLKPGGLFVSSTVCTGEVNRLVRFVLPPLGAIGIIPKLQYFDEQSLAQTISAAGFDIEYQHRPGPEKAVFIIARKGDAPYSPA